MNKSQGYAALTTLCMLATASAHAEVLHVSFTSQDPTYSGLFGSLSFNIDTAATTDILNTGTTSNCGTGTPGVYLNSQFSSGLSNATLVWNGVTYSLQSSIIYFEEDPIGCVFYLNMQLTFNNGTSFWTQDQPSGGPYSYATYNPSQLLSTALITGYNDRNTEAARLIVGGQVTGLDNFIGVVTPVH